MQRVDFAGEYDVRAELLGGPCEDCNVMTRRGIVAADAVVVRLRQDAQCALKPARQRLLVVFEGRVSLADVSGLAVAQLSAGDAALCEGPSPALVAHAPSTLLSLALSALD
jgi:environmental stress-induced protein Ves